MAAGKITEEDMHRAEDADDYLKGEICLNRTVNAYMDENEYEEVKR